MTLSALDDAALAARLALEAGRLLIAVREESGLAGKALGERGDREANRFLCEAIRAARPDDGLLSEEEKDNPARLAKSRVWIVDPVDGTWNFAKGLATFGVILAVCHKGQPVFGALYDPVMDDWVEASAGQGATLRGPSFSRPLRVSQETERRRMNGYIPMGLFPMETRRRLVQDFPDFGRVTSLRCSCHEYRMVAQGHSDFVLSGPTPHPWDHAAGALAVMEAGGVVRFLDGGAYRTERLKGVLLSASNEVLWQELAARFAYLA